MQIFRKKGAVLSAEAVAYLCVIILAVGVGLYGFSEWIDSGRRNSAKAELSTIASAVSTYKYDMDAYPKDLNTLTQKNGSYGPWLATLSKDPWGKDYHVVYNKDNTHFIVYTFANKEGAGTPPDPNNLSSTQSNTSCVYLVGQ